MKIATYVVDGEEYPGFVREDGRLVDFTTAFGALDRPSPLSVLAAVETESLTGLREAAEGLVDLESRDPAKVAWSAPITRPSKIVGVAGNNRLLQQSAKRIPTSPIYFVVPPSALVGHGGAVRMRKGYGLTHPEGELAAVIGRRCREESVETIMNAVFGYTIVNDISSASMESVDTIAFSAAGTAAFTNEDDETSDGGDMVFTYQGRAKGCDTFKPCGPWIVTADEIPDPSVLEVRVWMGDELCAEDTVGNLQYSVREILSDLSHYMTLEAGDIVHVGTAAVGKYKLRELDYQKWDAPCTIEIPGIGRLTNPVDRIE